MIEQAMINCPHCGAPFPFFADTSQGDHETVEDCQVCCRPILFIVQCEPGELISVEVERG